jgi:NADH dehydrogenase [ubiquinone] 1 alpha subcomplex assembly factor 7
MELCLSHPVHGYYIKQDPFGSQGDFITAPEVSQVFGELVGLWCASVWQQMGSPPFGLVELGPGRGTLMMDALRATRHVEGFHESMTVHLIETSPLLQTVQFHTLQNAHERLEWGESLDDLPEKPILLIANEFLDALPIRQHVQTPDGLRERRVGIDEATGELCFVLEQGGLSLAKGSSKIKDGTIMESCQAAKAVVGRIADHLREYGGAALMIDYGYLGDSHQDTLQAVKNHLYHPVLKDPGDADITAHVDFATLMEVAADHGVAVHGVVDQGKFLVRCGVEMRTDKLLEHAGDEEAVLLISGVKRLIDPNQMGELFKVMALVGDHRIMPAGMYVSHRL